jgi:hypothetical protein
VIRIRNIICLVGVVFFLCSCGTPSTTNKDPKITYILGETSSLEVSDYQSKGDLTITIDKDAYRINDSIKLSFTNKTNTELYITTNQLSLEKKVNNTWKTLIFNIVPNEGVGREIVALTKEKPYNSTTLTLDRWLTEGTFRIVHIVSKSPDLSTNDFTLISLPFKVS